MGTSSKHVLTNVRLSLGTLKSLKHRAVEERRPAAAIVREAVARYLLEDPKTERPESAARWFQGLKKLAAAAKKGPTDLAMNHDHYLYGTPQRPGGRRPVK